MIQQRWSDLSYLLVEYNWVDLFIVFLLPRPLSSLPSIYACFWFAWPLVCFTEMPFPCFALGAWCWSGSFVAPPSRVGKPCGCDCPLPCDANASRGLVCIFLFTLPPSLSFIHTWLYIVGVPKLAHVRVVSINPQDKLLGSPTLTLSRMNTRTHDCFPAKQDL